ncbi:MAG: hypothetical protein E6G04_06030 [Actinobacteria bacterium]|nr:MAG: hypothetical protein E6G04_06030 [Actinomycetota bacterium]
MTDTSGGASGGGTTPRSRTRGQIAIALTLALLGFLLATQLRSQQGLAQRLSIERESDLGQILTELTARSDQLSSEIVDLRVKLAQATGSEAQQRTLITDARQQLEALQILLGLVPVKGPGIQMTFEDPKSTLGPDVLTAIGPASTLAEAMRIPGGVVDSLAAEAGTSVRITEVSSASILHVSALPEFVHARPKTRR